jgi:ribosomal-protein-alanine N-acetyltransferase
VLVGFAVASVIPPQAEIETIAVAAEEQRGGIGGQLLRALLGELRRVGVTEILLEARVSNQPALRLYAAAGFRQTGVRPRYYADPQEDAVLMALRNL